MQRFAVQIKSAVWAKLKDIYDKYADGAQCMPISRLESLVKEVLREETPAEVDYVVKNINRIDKDNSGTLDFEQIGNFLLKRHCGQMALQRMHRSNLIKSGHIRKIARQQFAELINSAYDFLGVQVDQKVTSEIFQNIDKDRDGLITYAEYFGFTDAYLLDTRPVADRKKPQVEKVQIARKSSGANQPAKEFQSRLRRFLMTELRRIFENYDKDMNNLLDNEEKRLMLIELFGLNVDEISRVISNYFRADTNGKYQSFPAFASNFLHYATDHGWFNLSKQLLPRGRVNFSQSEFYRLIDQSFRHLNIGRVNKILFQNYFRILDYNQDAMVQYSDFKTWVARFLAPQRYYGTEYYLKEDDETLPYGRGMISDPPSRVEHSPARSLDSSRKSMKLSGIKYDSRVDAKQKLPRPTSNLRDSQISVVSNRSGKQYICKFTFSSLDLARRVRNQMFSILQRLDKNHNGQFQEPEIVEALQVLMKADKHEVMYVIANVFRYDRNGDHIVTYEELANFFLQIHFGQIAIQRLHRQNSYVRGAERMMSMQEFVRTLDYALSFIEVQPYEREVETLFREVDLNKDGWITYQEYFQFLIHYFGTKSVVAQAERVERVERVERIEKVEVVTITVPEIQTNKVITHRVAQVPPQQRFSRLIRTQALVLFIEYDRNKNVKFEREQALQIARDVLDQTQQEAWAMVNRVFQKNPQFVEYNHLLNRFLQIHSSEVILQRLHRQGLLRNYKQKTLDLQDFMVLINSAFVRVSVLPTRDQYTQIFKRIGASQRISYRQYQHFVARYLGKSEDRSFDTAFEEPSRLSQYVKRTQSNTSGQAKDVEVATEIFSSLRSLYEKYDRNNEGIQRGAFEQFVREAFSKTKKQHIEYILWAVFRVDQNMDGRINLSQAAPYILRLQAELALQDFHRANHTLANKERLSHQDFLTVLRVAYDFCGSLQRETLGQIFERLDSDNDGYVSDLEYLSWTLCMSRQLVAQN